MDAVAQAFGHLVIDLSAKTGQATKGGLHMSAGATEPVVEVEVAKGGIEVVTPQQADHTTAEPDTFRIAGRAVERVLRFGEFVDLLRLLGGLLAGRRLVFGVVALGEGRRIEAYCGQYQKQRGG